MEAARSAHGGMQSPVPWGRELRPGASSSALLAQSNFHGPISLQQEFTIPGVTDNQGIALSRATVPQVMASAKTNLDYLKSLLREAYQQT